MNDHHIIETLKILYSRVHEQFVGVRPGKSYIKNKNQHKRIAAALYLSILLSLVLTRK